MAGRRDDLRKAALKANMARRKAQMRGRQQAAGPADTETAEPPETGPDTNPDTNPDTGPDTGTAET